MEVERLDDATEFRHVADRMLLAHETANNLIIGVCGTAARDPDHFESFMGSLVRQDGQIVAVAVQTPPHNLILGTPALGEAVRHLAREADDLPGVVGTRPEVDVFVEAWGNATRTMRQGIYQLSEVQIAIETSPRRATVDDRDLLLDWVFQFQDEASPSRPDRAQVERALDRRLHTDEDIGGMWLLDVEGKPVSMSGYANPTPHGIRIGPVYTPPEHRGNGYATNLVAAQSQWLLDHGYDFCFLYTDLDNPTSNSIYKRIGYEMVCESAEYTFSQ